MKTINCHTNLVWNTLMAMPGFSFLSKLGTGYCTYKGVDVKYCFTGIETIEELEKAIQTN